MVSCIDYPFIKLVQREKDDSRNFGNKVYAIRRGFEEIDNLDYDYYCNLDADVSFETDFLETLIKKFENDPKLGICGGRIYDLVKGKFREQKSELHSVAGPVQFFRRTCYESFGGYQPFKSGFIDGHAEISARMHGWETRTFLELKVQHYRPAGTVKGSRLKIKYEGGKFEYRFGYSYLYHFLRSLSTFRHKPFILGGIASMIGFLSCIVKCEKRLVEKDFINFVREEQSDRLTNKFKSFLR